VNDLLHYTCQRTGDCLSC